MGRKRLTFTHRTWHKDMLSDAQILLLELKADVKSAYPKNKTLQLKINNLQVVMNNLKLRLRAES